MGKRVALAAGAVVLLMLGIALGQFLALRGGALISVGAGGGEALQNLRLLPAGEGSPGQSAEWRVDINRAMADELRELPGIGEAIAGRIVQHREEMGDFQSIEEIMAVRGIGEGLFSRIKDYIICGQ